METVVDILDSKREPINSDERETRIAGKLKKQLFPYYGATGQVGWIDGYLFDEEILLLGEDGAPFIESSKPKAYVVRGKSWVNNHAHVLRALLGLTTNTFLKHYLDIFDYHGFVTGTTRLKLPQGPLKRIPVPLPPLPEQHRIVAKVEELFSKLDAGVEALKKVKAELKRYRQSVLKHAFEGKLTEEWRKNLILKETKRSKSDYRMVAEPAAIYELKDRSDSSSPSTIQNDMQYEPASVLLARIREERKKKLGSKYKEPEPIDTSELPELPEGWVWAKVMEAGRVQLGRQRAPQYHNGNDMRPYLRVANVFENRIDTSDILQMNFDPDVYETFKLHYGDILLNEGQSPEFLGRPAMYRNEVPGACFQNTLIRFQAASGLMPEYALAVFRGYLHTGRFRKTSQITTNLAHMSAGRFAEIEFPLPSQAEQQAIVNELDRVFSIADAVEKTVDEQLQQAERLRQSILKRAFEGKLVPQDPTDPPASVLLEQIKLEKENRREESGAGSKKKRKTIIGTFN